MKKYIGINTLFYFLYMLGSCIIVMLIEALFTNVVEKFVVLSYPVLTAIRIAIYTLAIPVILAVAGRSEGYREGYCAVGATIAAGLLATLPHLIFAMLFKFQAFVSGAVRFTAGMIHNGWGITYDSLINETPYYMFLLVFVVYGLLYTAVLTVSKYLGAQKRILDRAELRMGEDEVTEEAPNGVGD